MPPKSAAPLRLPPQSNNALFGIEYICPVCGDVFLCCSDQWAYKLNDRNHTHVCTWHCLRKAEAEGAKPFATRTRRFRKVKD